MEGVNLTNLGEKLHKLLDAADGMTTEEAVRYLEHGREMVEALQGLIGWALHTVAQSNPDNDILPRGYEKWKKLIREVGK